MKAISTPRICRPFSRALVQGATALGHNTERLRQAMAYGARAHAGQRRKSGESFFVHALQVARAVQAMGGLEVDVLAALHHDVVEDCPAYRLEDIEIAWGEDVAARVGTLTKNYSLPTPELRVADAFGRLWQAMGQHGAGVGLVKLLDRAHNAATSAVIGPDKLARMRRENRHMFAPMARFIGARGLATYLASPPEVWWQASPDFVGHMQACQPRLVLA